MGKLNATRVRAIREAGRYHDGDGLMLDVKASGSKSWVVRLQANGKRRDFGLGSAKDVDLAKARELARDYRKKLRSGIDPNHDRKLKPGKGVPTFREAAERYHCETKVGWGNGKHRDQWLATLRTYAFPSIGDVPIDQVATGAVRDLLTPIWRSKSETAGRVLQRVKSVMEYAHAMSWLDRPFAMETVKRSLPSRIKTAGHFKAMPIADVPSFMASLTKGDTVSRVALEACILTASRSGEIRGACWSELDLDEKTWTIPAARMKAGRDHVVALSTDAVNAFRRAEKFRRADSDHVFPGLGRGKALSDGTLRKMIKDLGRSETVHGFRSTFRDWVAERTDIPGEVAEAALAHANTNAVEAAYRRTNYLEKRRPLMEQWGGFCMSETRPEAPGPAAPSAS